MKWNFTKELQENNHEMEFTKELQENDHEMEFYKGITGKRP